MSEQQRIVNRRVNRIVEDHLFDAFRELFRWADDGYATHEDIRVSLELGWELGDMWNDWLSDDE